MHKTENTVRVWKVVTLPQNRLGIKAQGSFGISPWYVVEGPIGETQEATKLNTASVCLQLQHYLNAVSSRPAWLADMYVASPNCLESLDGTRIQVVGPMREVQEGSEIWEIDETFGSMRNQMIHRLVG